jgi:thiamine biosynthesis lipoprotein
VTTTASGLERAQQAAAESVSSVDLACSRFRSDSELSALNRGAGAWVPVGEVLLDAMARST